MCSEQSEKQEHRSKEKSNNYLNLGGENTFETAQ